MPRGLRRPLHPWFRRRFYRHFDDPVSLPFAHAYISNQKNLETHAFRPFIGYVQRNRRYSASLPGWTYKDRQIRYASHLDSHIFAFYAYRLVQALEDFYRANGISDSVLAYRPLGKSNVDLAIEAFDRIRNTGTCTVLALDITGFFDNIRHHDLKLQWQRLSGVAQLPVAEYKVLRAITRYAHVDREVALRALGISRRAGVSGDTRLCDGKDFDQKLRQAGLVQVNTTGIGIPQGAPISAVMSNLYLAQFDVAVAGHISPYGGVYRRYSDDILWVGPSANEAAFLAFVTAELARVGLALNPAKQERTEFVASPNGGVTSSAPLGYLGLTFDGRSVRIRSKSLARYYQRLKSAVRSSFRAAKKANDGSKIYRRKLYRKFSYIGKQNFISYALRAARTSSSLAIRRQIRGHWKKLKQIIRDADDSL